MYFDSYNHLLSEYEDVLRSRAIYSNLTKKNRWLQVRYIYGQLVTRSRTVNRLFPSSLVGDATRTVNSTHSSDAPTRYRESAGFATRRSIQATLQSILMTLFVDSGGSKIVEYIRDATSISLHHVRYGVRTQVYQSFDLLQSNPTLYM